MPRSHSNPLLTGLDTGKKRAKSEPASIAAWQVQEGRPGRLGCCRRAFPAAAAADSCAAARLCSSSSPHPQAVLFGRHAHHEDAPVQITAASTVMTADETYHFTAATGRKRGAHVVGMACAARPLLLSMRTLPSMPVGPTLVAEHKYDYPLPKLIVLGILAGVSWALLPRNMCPALHDSMLCHLPCPAVSSGSQYL